MGISIEDILQGHGIGAAGSGGIQVVKSESEPVTGLVDGLFWYNPVKEETKMYLNGEFREIGGGGSVITPIFGQTTTVAVTNEVTIPIANYVPGEDVLLVSQNDTSLTETIDFTIDKAAKKIIKVTGNWNDKTHFAFTVLATTPTGRADNISLFQMEDHVTVGAGVQSVTFAIPAYNPQFDILRVHQRNLEIFKGVDWTLNPDGQSIKLTYALTDYEEFHFTVYKKIRDNAPAGSIDGSSLLPNSVAEDKLNFVPAKAEDVAVIDQKLTAQTEEVASVKQTVDTHVNDYVKHPAYGATAGTNAYTVTLSPAPSALVEGMGIVLKVGTTATGVCTLNVNGLGVKSILKSDGTVANNLKAGCVYTVRYSGTAFILQGEGSGDAKKEFAALSSATKGQEKIFFQNDDAIFSSEVAVVPVTGFVFYARKYDRKTGALLKMIDLTEFNGSPTGGSYHFSYTDQGFFVTNDYGVGIKIYNENKTLIHSDTTLPETGGAGHVQYGRNNQEYVQASPYYIRLFALNGTYIADVLTISSSASYTALDSMQLYRNKEGNIQAHATIARSSGSYHYCKDLLALELRHVNAGLADLTEIKYSSLMLNYTAQLNYSK